MSGLYAKLFYFSIHRLTDRFSMIIIISTAVREKRGFGLPVPGLQAAGLPAFSLYRAAQARPAFFSF